MIEKDQCVGHPAKDPDLLKFAGSAASPAGSNDTRARGACRTYSVKEYFLIGNV